MYTCASEMSFNHISRMCIFDHMFSLAVRIEHLMIWFCMNQFRPC